MLNLTQIKKLRKRKWLTLFSSNDIEKIFQDVGPSEGLLFSSHFSLAWFVKQIFCNSIGKPLELAPFQMVLLDMLWHKKFPIVLGTRGMGKTFMLGLYAALRAILVPGSKVVICGAGFRQAKLVFQAIERLYNASPIFQEACKDRPKYGSDQAYLTVGLSTITAIPIGDGTKIRGQRASVLLADEFASIPEEIFEIVISPFTAVHLNPMERVATEAFIARLQALGADQSVIDLIERTQDFGNQIVISGTASYKHNHFYKRYKTYKAFIQSEGNPETLRKILEQRSIEVSGKKDNLTRDEISMMAKTWRQYAIFQLPYYGLPKGFLDAGTIRSDKATFPKSRFMMEYESQFPDDSDGFIKRSAIDNSTPRIPLNTPVNIELYGDPRATYVMGLDPAKDNDNFGCVVLKITSRGKELVYCSAWNRTDYSVSTQRIRDICKRFNIQYIAMDKGGGGSSVQEWLAKKTDDVKDHELIWPIKEQIEDLRLLSAPGKKILEMVNFSPGWIAEAAHGLEASIQQQNLLFPYEGSTDAIVSQYQRHFGEDSVTDTVKEKLERDLWGIDDYDSKKGNNEERYGVWQNISECINETCAIVRKVTAGGTEQFVLPDLADQSEGLDMRRRDRFTALMLANYAAKVYMGYGQKTANLPGVSAGSRRNSRGIMNRHLANRRGRVAF